MNKPTNFAGKKEINSHNHKLTAECFTKCTKWKLNSTLTLNKTSTGLIFQGKGFFFKKLQSCILNNFQVIDDISEISKSTLKNIEDKTLIPENNYSDERFDYSIFKFPLNNADFQIPFTNNNTTNDLSNVLFLEFDINSNSISKDHLKSIKDINNDFVEKEIHFVLNGTIHGKPVFKNELRFSMEARKFIKSIKFRLENYKTEFIEKQKSIQKSNPNFEIKNSKFNFFTRIIHNNIGIEFTKSNFEDVETYPTNFNSIVNSNITIEKIYFEIIIPSQVIYSQEYTKKNYKENGSKSTFDNNLINSYSNFSNLSLKSTNPNQSKSWEVEKSNSANWTKASRDKDKCYNNYHEQSIYNLNTDYTSKNFNMVEDRNHLEGRYTMGYNNKSKYSKEYQPLYEKEMNGKYAGSSSSKYSNGNSNHSNGNTSNYSNYSNVSNSKSNYSNNSRKSSAGSGHNSINSSEHSSPVLSNLCKTGKNYSFQILLAHYEGVCNFLIFAKSCTPYVHKADTHLIDDIKINNFFKNFEKVSAFGLDVNYIFDNEISPVNYSPTLSSMEILITDILTCERIIEEIKSIRNLEPNKFFEREFDRLEYYPNENLKFICYEGMVKIEFYETKPPHSRFILSIQLEQIFNNLKSYDSIDFSKISKSSWFSILWSPFKSPKPQFANTSFLVYYQFSYSDTEMYYRGFSDYLEIPIVGILPVKFDDSVWLHRISKINLGSNNKINFTSTLIDFKFALNDSVNNVHEFVFSNTDRTSTDYDLYVKNNM